MKIVNVVATFLCVGLIFILPAMAFAFPNEPDGFRGLKWGDPIMEGMKYIGEEKGMLGYIRLDDKMQIGDAYLSYIVYLFDVYTKRFFGVNMGFEGEENYDRLKIILEGRFGEGEKAGLYRILWIGQKATINLDYDLAEEKGHLGIYSTVLFAEKIERDKKKAAEDAAGDF